MPPTPTAAAPIAGTIAVATVTFLPLLVIGMQLTIRLYQSDAAIDAATAKRVVLFLLFGAVLTTVSGINALTIIAPTDAPPTLGETAAPLQLALFSALLAIGILSHRMIRYEFQTDEPAGTDTSDPSDDS